MAKLVILTQGMTGRAHELNVDRTTIGRVEDNTFQIPDPSVSSHHCEVILSGGDILIRDLNSTNGSYINGEKITEKVLKPGQTLRLGQIELKLDDGTPVVATPVPATAPAAAPAKKKPVDSTMVIPRGVSLGELEQGGGRPPGFESATAFSKKSNRINKFFIVGVIVVAIIIAVLLYYALWLAKHK
ncbi:MAG: FHA domain-containing protein [Limisphaerales bacterium]